MEFVFFLVILVVYIPLYTYVVKSQIHFYSKRIIKIFMALWFVVLSLTLLHPYGLYDVSGTSYVIFLVFITSLVLGYTSKRKISHERINYKKINYKHCLDDIIESKLFLLFLVSAICILGYLMSKRAILLSSYTVAEMRGEVKMDIFEGSSLLGLPYFSVISPLLYVISFLLAYMALFSRRGHWLQIVLCFLYVLFIALINGGRQEIFGVVIAILFLFIVKDLIIKKTLKSSIFITLSIVLVFTLIFIVLSYMTAQRADGTIKDFSYEAVVYGSNILLEHFVTYFTGPIVAFDYALQNDYLVKTGGLNWGCGTMGFIDGFLTIFLNNLGINHKVVISPLTDYIQNNWILVGPGINFNFAYTAVLFYYTDFGFIGIAVIPFLFGRIVKSVMDNFFHSGNPALLILSAYLFYVMLYTVFSWSLYAASPAFTFLYIYLLYKILQRKMCKYYIN